MGQPRRVGLLIALAFAGALSVLLGAARAADSDAGDGNTVSALSPPTVVNLRIGRHPDKTRLVLDLTDEAAYSYALGADGRRLSIDLPDSHWRAPTEAARATGAVTEYSFLPNPDGGGRLTVLTDRPVSVAPPLMLPQVGTIGPRLVFDLHPAATDGFAAGEAVPMTVADGAAPDATPPAAAPKADADPNSRFDVTEEAAASRFDVTEEAQDPNGGGGELEISGYFAADLRGFFHAPRHADQDGQRLQPSLILQPEFRYEWNDGDDRIAFVPFLRLDAVDRKRRHADLRELNWLHVAPSWDLRLGVGKVFWGVTESRHLVDVVNQTDLIENPDGEDKLGQPMVNLNLLVGDWGTLGLFVLPGFRERTFPGRDGRLRTALPVATDEPVFESDLERYHVDLAARWSIVLGDWDLGLSHFWGTGREPRLVPGTDSGGRPHLVPHYDLIHQTGLDLQATKGPWLWKLEAMTRSGHGDRFFAAVPGVEYTLYDVFDQGADLGLLAEYLYDGRDSTAPPTMFDDDFFVGTRLVFNDMQSTEILAGAVIDRDSQATALSIEAERRLGAGWTAELEGRFYVNVPSSDPLAGLRDDDHLQVTIFRYF